MSRIDEILADLSTQDADFWTTGRLLTIDGHPAGLWLPEAIAEAIDAPDDGQVISLDDLHDILGRLAALPDRLPDGGR
jgi:hypothetical protein